MHARLAAGRDRRLNAWLMGFLVLFSWTLVLVTWPVVRMVSTGALSSLDLSFQRTWTGLAGNTLMGWVVGGIAALIIGLPHATARRAACAKRTASGSWSPQQRRSSRLPPT